MRCRTDKIVVRFGSMSASRSSLQFSRYMTTMAVAYYGGQRNGSLPIFCFFFQRRTWFVTMKLLGHVEFREAFKPTRAMTKATVLLMLLML